MLSNPNPNPIGDRVFWVYPILGSLKNTKKNQKSKDRNTKMIPKTKTIVIWSIKSADMKNPFCIIKKKKNSTIQIYIPSKSKRIIPLIGEKKYITSKNIYTVREREMLNMYLYPLGRETESCGFESEMGREQRENKT